MEMDIRMNCFKKKGGMWYETRSIWKQRFTFIFQCRHHLQIIHCSQRWTSCLIPSMKIYWGLFWFNDLTASFTSSMLKLILRSLFKYCKDGKSQCVKSGAYQECETGWKFKIRRGLAVTTHVCFGGIIVLQNYLPSGFSNTTRNSSHVV